MPLSKPKLSDRFYTWLQTNRKCWRLVATKLSAIVLAATLAMAASSETRVAEVGDFIVVFAEISGCPRFPGIIAAPEIGEDGAIHLPHLNPIQVAGSTERQVFEEVSLAIATQRPDRDVPSSLRVDVLTQYEFADLRDLYYVSLHYLANDRCDKPASEEWRLWRNRWNQEWQHMEHLKRLERDRTAALSLAQSRQQGRFAPGGSLRGLSSLKP